MPVCVLMFIENHSWVASLKASSSFCNISLLLYFLCFFHSFHISFYLTHSDLLDQVKLTLDVFCKPACALTAAYTSVLLIFKVWKANTWRRSVPEISEKVYIFWDLVLTFWHSVSCAMKRKEHFSAAHSLNYNSITLVCCKVFSSGIQRCVSWPTHHFR